jgi:thiamine biosynthesis lipoprotein
MIVRLAVHAMATRFELVLDGEDEPALRAVGEEALEAIEEAGRRLSCFDPGSLLSHVNRRAADRAVPVDADLLELLAESRRVSRDSEGAFDVTVAPLMARWGFRGEGSEPAAADPGVAVAMDDVVLDEVAGTVRFRRHGVALDLGGIGKGHGLDAAAATLREHGVDRALLHGGTSSVVAIGAPPGGPGWPVAIAGADTTVRLRDAALSVSAPGGRVTRDGDGRAVGHVMDPRRGAPARGVALAAVVAPTARLADAWSTALVVLGRFPPGLPAALDALLVRETPDGPAPLVRRGATGAFDEPRRVRSPVARAQRGAAAGPARTLEMPDERM